MRTIGLNPNSAFVNSIQKINTVVDAGPVWSAAGYVLSKTPKYRKLFDSSGLIHEAAEVMFHGQVSKGLERARRYVGFMFTKIEEGNRRHAFTSFYLKGQKGLKLSEEDAFWYAVNGVHRTQFQYGKLGMPKLLRGKGGVAFQFSSFPIKSAEFFLSLWHSGPKGKAKALAWIGGMEYGREKIKDLLEIDLSNQLGVGVNYDEVFKSLEDLGEGELTKVWRHIKVAYAPGTGMLPQGPGPFVHLLGAVWSLDPRRIERELSPVQFDRMAKFVDAIDNKSGGMYPIYNTHTWLSPISKKLGLPPLREYPRNMKKLYELDLNQLLLRTFGPKPTAEVEQRVAKYARNLDERKRKEIMTGIADDMVMGNLDRVGSVLDDEGFLVMPSMQGLAAAIGRKYLTDEQRAMFGGGMKSKLWHEVHGE